MNVNYAGNLITSILAALANYRVCTVATYTLYGRYCNMVLFHIVVARSNCTLSIEPVRAHRKERCISGLKH